MGIFLFFTASSSVLGPIQPLIQRIPETLYPQEKRPGRKDDHALPSSAEVNNVPEHLPGVFHSHSGLKQEDALPFGFLICCHECYREPGKAGTERHKPCTCFC
jgi:hypothetical protein